MIDKQNGDLVNDKYTGWTNQEGSYKNMPWHNQPKVSKQVQLEGFSSRLQQWV